MGSYEGNRQQSPRPLSNFQRYRGGPGVDPAQEGVHGVLRYLDELLLLEAPGSSEGSNALVITFVTCEELGVPVAMDKVEGPVV